ncbi:phenylacetic acid degradation operon negative regulatory protein PaaX [Paraburkholderia dinghuensis]|uniref:phenylacetic acid degradation operon negative regulatory protein PaaX n=1 Tax=Paraburkholderia dinghuensis TaxID=2305225 RepID=UPI001628BF4C|nr:phenylacetic acid degradation operon negative regulatory protein PaaX [Paraburkholderia dinghuensis]
MLSRIHQRIDDFRHQGRVQTGSLVISVFGDAVVPRGGRIWLGSLIRLLAPLELNERLIRTAVFRLTKEAWLLAEPSGRRSDYALSPSGQRRFEDAARYIYASTAPQWDQRWRLIMTVGKLTQKDRDGLRRAMFWQGFGLLGGDCFVHPGADMSAAFDALIAEGLGSVLDKLKPLIAADVQLEGTANDQRMVHEAWDLENLSGMYTEFVSRYQPILGQLRDSHDALDDESAFLLRLLLIHDYRRLLLRDPALPDVLLPADWPGQHARLVCKEIYRRLLTASERHLDKNFHLANESTPLAAPILFERFREADPLAH